MVERILDCRVIVFDNTLQNLTVVDILRLGHATFESVDEEHVEENPVDSQVEHFAESGIDVFEEDVTACTPT